MPSKRPLIDPFVTWPKPYRNWSSVHAAAEACWKLAESEWQARNGGRDPEWLMYGATALALDILEDAREAHGLPLGATMQDVMAVAKTTEGVEDGQKRVDWVLRLLDYAIEREATL
jgi:hypothetical protein